MNLNAPIAVIDSGLGGLTVAKAIHQVLPHERILYFGDTARLPYGSKSPKTVANFVKQIICWLRQYRCKHVVLACNTATALALPAVRNEFPALSISGVIEPGAKAAIVAAGSRDIPCIGVIATEATIRSRAYERAIGRRRHHAKILLKSTPLLVPMIEEGRGCDDPLVSLALRQYLHPLVERRLDVLVLGCTHYPLLKPAVLRILPAQVPVIDSAQMCAQDVERRLMRSHLLSPMHRSNEHWLTPVVTDDAERFQTLASRFLGEPVPAPHTLSVDQLYIATAAVAAERYVKSA
jgi:glutamate racemase